MFGAENCGISQVNIPAVLIANGLGACLMIVLLLSKRRNGIMVSLDSRIFDGMCGLCLTAQHNPAWGQTRPDNVSKEVELEEIVVSSTRIGNKGSLSNSKVDGSELQETNMGENLPYLLQRTPSLVVTSDDGLGIGYVYFRVRGTDQSRINMTINGVPLNDSESQSVFWVNMTDMVGYLSSGKAGTQTSFLEINVVGDALKHAGESVLPNSNRYL